MVNNYMRIINNHSDTKLHKTRQSLWKQTESVFQTPTARQKEALSRFLHTLSAASLVGAATHIFSGTPFTLLTILRIVALLAYGIGALIAGLIINQGE